MTDTTERLETEARQHRQALREDLDAIFDRLSPGQIMDEVLSSTGGANRFVSALGAQVRDNPMPVLLTAAGLAWLAFGTRRPSDAASPELNPELHAASVPVDPADYDADFHHRRIEIAEAGCVRLEHDTDEDYQVRLAHARAQAMGLEPAHDEDHARFRDRVSAEAAKARDRARAARHRIADGAARARRSAARAYDAAGHAAASAIGSARDGAVKASGAARHAARDSWRSAANLHEHSPMATGAIALAVGAVAGALLPLSRAERDALSEPADRLGEGAARLADKAARAARETLGDIEAERDRERSSPEPDAGGGSTLAPPPG